ncbi:MAG: hypothetical protein H8D45_20510 [Bacteroidetes bacterium]|nr:hypothetical protein [Bacteroidota bacterium]MBL7104752.1 hypothetical protein [Bacteroidales bacterium]
MQTAILNSDSKKDFNLLLELAKKLNIKAKVLTETEIEEIGLTNVIKQGRTGEFVNTKKFLEKLRK